MVRFAASLYSYIATRRSMEDNEVLREKSKEAEADLQVKHELTLLFLDTIPDSVAFFSQQHGDARSDHLPTDNRHTGSPVVIACVI